MESKQSLFNLREQFSDLNIKEVETNHAVYIPESEVNKIFNSITKIFAKKGNGTGFFMELKIDNVQRYFLVTCHHVVLKEDVDSRETIRISYGKKNEEIIKFIMLNDSERFIKCFDDPVDITLIEIISKDSIPIDKFLVPDYSYKNCSDFNYYLGKDFYSAGYPGDKMINGERIVCSGKIKEIKDFEFAHSLDTKGGSSGSPICLIDDARVVGIHKSGIKGIQTNYGTFIGFVIKKLEGKKIFMGMLGTRISPSEFKLFDLKRCSDNIYKLCLTAELYAIKIGDKYDYRPKFSGSIKNENLFNNYTTEELLNILKKEIELCKSLLNEYYLKYGELLRLNNVNFSFFSKFFNELKSFLKNEYEKSIYNDIIKMFKQFIE